MSAGPSTFYGLKIKFEVYFNCTIKERAIMMPLNFITMRHARSEGNEATEKIRSGRYNEIPSNLYDVPGWQWRLTPEGVKQCKAASAWLKANFPKDFFDAGFASWYVRARETAALLDLGLKWRMNYFIREREYGIFDCIPRPEELKGNLDARKNKKCNRMFWNPIGGESIAGLLIRPDRLFETIHREFSQGNVIVLNHGDTMDATRVLLEYLSPEKFQKMGNDPKCKIHNCGILHYTRINPKDPEDIKPYLDWVRYINPMDPPADPDSVWKKITRKKYSDEELLNQAKRYRCYFS